jgi:TIR domain
VEAISVSPQKLVRVFCSYSHADERYRAKLEKALSVLRNEGAIEAWSDHKIGAGESIDNAIDENLPRSQLILLLISSNFLASPYCYSNEMKRALEMHDAKIARVIPIIVNYCDWQHTPFAKRTLKALPTDANPVVNWRPQDKAWAVIVKGIREALADLKVSDSSVPVPRIPNSPIDPGDLGAPRPSYNTIAVGLYLGYLPDTEVQQVSLGRPNDEQDGLPVTLSLALNASNTRIAYTRRDPADVYSEPRVVAVQEAPSGQWWVHQWLLGSGEYEGLPATDYRDADVFTVYQLDIPKAAIWWPASGLLSVQYEDGQYYPGLDIFGSAHDESVDESGAPPTDSMAHAKDAPSAASAVLHYLVLRHNPGELAMYQTIEEELDLHGQVLDDAIHELKHGGLIEGSSGPGNQRRHVKPLPRAWAAVDKTIIGFDIEANKLLIARWAIYESPIEAETLEERTGLPSYQLNITALLMAEEGELDLFRPIGRSQYAFASATANHKTRQMLARSPAN